MRLLLLLISILPSLCFAEITLTSHISSEIWEGDQIKATLEWTDKDWVPEKLDFTNGVYLVSQKPVEDADKNELTIIITDREMLASLALKEDKKQYPVKVVGFNFKKERIKKGSYIFRQNLSYYGSYFIYVLIACMLGGLIYFFIRKRNLRLKQQKWQLRKNDLVKLVKQVSDKESYNQFYY